ncbi:MAG TPA: tetratricopeptide repeat protein [Thermoanaerobaculia bacterium]|nr:tetratricopeptide repeat protein [Thermoanaerobaculia bacterium]
MRTAGRSPAETENLRGLALMLSGSPRKAVASFDLALDLDPKLAAARFNRAIAWLRLSELARASSEFETLYDDPASGMRASAAYHNALALDGLGRAADAEAWLRRALALDPGHDSAVLYLGILLERRGDLQGAGKQYKEFVARNPSSPVGHLRYGVSAQRAGFNEVARKSLQRVVDLAPDSPEAAEARKFLVMWE